MSTIEGTEKTQNSETYKPQKFSGSLMVPLFAAASLYLSSIEYLLPRPIPFFRFGLANIAILVALRNFSLHDLLTLVMLKVLGLGILNGTIASYVFVFSLFGSFSGLACMYLASRFSSKCITLVGISIIGALGSNAVQILCAILYIFGRNAWIIAPYLLMLGIASSYVVGVIAQHFACNSTLLPQLMQSYKHSTSITHHPSHIGTRTHSLLHKPTILLMCGIVAGIAYTISTSLLARIIQVFMFFIAARSVKRIKISYFCMLVASVTCFAILIPQGKVLFSLGSFAITRGALHNGLFRALTLCGYVFLSLWCISPKLHLPGTLGSMLAKTLRFFYLLWTHAATHTKHHAKTLPNAYSFTHHAEYLAERVLQMYASPHVDSQTEPHAHNSLISSHTLPQNKAYLTHETPWHYAISSIVISYIAFFIF